MHRVLVAIGLLAVLLTAARTSYAQPADLAEGWACVIWTNGGDAVALEGVPAPVRLTGIDVPGLPADTLLDWIIADAGCWVYVEPATPSWDEATQQYRAYLWLIDPEVGWWLVEEELVATGSARVSYRGYPEDAYAPILHAAEQHAQEHRLGIWASRAR